jgi:hypothetical protein
MAIKYPIEYELSPKGVSAGMRWLTLRLKNVGDTNLIGLDAKLNSLDSYSVHVHGTGNYVGVLKPGEEQVVPYQALASSTGWTYASLDGWEGTSLFHWESPRIKLTVGEDVASLESLLVVAQSPSSVDGKIRCEATILGSSRSDALRLEFWVETPSFEFEQLATVDLEELSSDQEAHCVAKIAPQEEGLYTIYAYLYDGARRIDHELEHVRVDPTSVKAEPPSSVQS